jgi:hypothetical protein
MTVHSRNNRKWNAARASTPSRDFLVVSDGCANLLTDNDENVARRTAE